MMSDGMLSQDEIDALLRGAADDEEETESYEDVFFTEDYLSNMEQDALGEIGNISFGSSATALSTLLNQKVEITTPSVSVILPKKLQEEFPHPYVAIQVNYTDGFAGSNLLVIQHRDAAIIADLMLGGNGENPSEMMGDIQLSAVQEAMNQMMGSAATSMSTIFNKRVDISPPSIDILDLTQGEGADRIPDDIIVKVSFRLKIGHLIDSSIMQLLPLNFAKSLVNELLNPGQNDGEAGNAGMDDLNSSYTADSPVDQMDAKTYSDPFAGEFKQTGQPAQQEKVPVYQEKQYSEPVNAYGQVSQPAHQPQHFGSNFTQAEQANVQPAVFSNFEPYPGLQGTETKNLNMLLDIPLQITVELGRTKRSVKEILELSQGSIIELDKLAGEPVDILVNNRLIAQGEVVVIDENFGVRVTDIISQTDRIKKLK